MLIAICDDEPLFCKILKDKLYSYSNKNNLNYCVDVFYDGQELLSEIREYDIVFLDYQMPNIDGLATAKEIRKRNMLSMIVFISSFPEVVYKTFQYDTFRFLIKPLKDEELYEALDSFRKKKGLHYPVLIYSGGEHIKIYTGDIVYIEADGRNCIIRTVKDSISCTKSIKYVFSLLPSNCFFFTHRSYVVNFNSILSFNKNSIKLINGEVAKISRDRYSEFLDSLNTYLEYISI
ncbi:LytR/AlgR family response regulator transcription factor [Ruminococcus sp.]|jgi:two-component system, LytTR family, response regulator LytT